MAKSIDYMTLFLAIVALVLLAGKREWWPGFYSPYLFGFAFLLSALMIRISSFAFRPLSGQDRVEAVFLRFVIAFSLTLNALGELYLYQLYRFGLQFDKLVHFSVAFLFVIAIANYDQAHYGFDSRKALREAVTIVFICSILWEAAEYLSDALFNTKEFGMYGQNKFYDTLFDLIADLFGVSSSSMLMAFPNAHNRFIGRVFRRRMIRK
jgi:hypothetical protein